MPAGARLGDKAQCPMDTHGCPACPHPTIGPAISGSPDVLTNGRPAIRQNDPGMHAACCGANTWNAVQGSATVFINGKPAVRMGDPTRHCGGMGRVVEGSPNVMIGADSSSGGGAGAPSRAASTSGGGAGAAGSSTTAQKNSADSAQSSDAGSNANARFASAPQSSAPGRQAQPQDEQEHVNVVSATLTSPGGQTLAFEQVVLVKAGTDEQVAGPFDVGEDGKVAVIVPDAGAYDFKILEPDVDVVVPRPPDLGTNLHVQFLANGLPVTGRTVQISGDGVSVAVELGPQGELDVAVPSGEYDIKVGRDTFKAHSLTRADLEAGGSHYQFAVEVDDDVDHEQARANRLPESEVDIDQGD